MKQRSDKEVLGWISQDLKDRYSWITSVSYNDCEDYLLDLTLDTSYGEVKAEVKTSRGHEIKDSEGNWNPYFSTSNSQGILRFSKLFQGLEFPEEKHVYMINASVKKGNRLSLLDPRCKFKEIEKNQAALIYISKGGYLIWDYKALAESFLGYCWTYCYHTEDFRKDNTQEKELKALFAFEGAKWIETETIFN